MCLSQEAKIQNTTDNNVSVIIDEELQFPSSPWDKLIKQMSKSKLKNTTKINLNKYWSKFGEILTSPSKTKSDKIFTTSHQTPVKKRLDFIEYNNKSTKVNDVQVRDNMIKNRYELLDADEINENFINEVKELWSYKVADKCQHCNSY